MEINSSIIITVYFNSKISESDKYGRAKIYKKAFELKQIDRYMGICRLK